MQRTKSIQQEHLNYSCSVKWDRMSLFIVVDRSENGKVEQLVLLHNKYKLPLCMVTNEIEQRHMNMFTRGYKNC